MEGIRTMGKSGGMCLRLKRAGTIATCGMAFQFGGCDFGTVSTSVTLNGADLIVTLIRAAILTPIDNAITDFVNDAFTDDED